MNSMIPLVLRYGLTCFLAIVFVAQAQSANATTIIEWGGNYVSSDTLLDGVPKSSGGSTTYAYSLTELRSPAGPDFYGAFSLTNESGSGTPEFSTYSLSKSAPNNAIRFGATPESGSGSLIVRGLLFFQKPSFLGGAADNTVTLGADSSLKLNVTSSAPGGIENVRQTKAAVYASVGGVWNWYVSSATKAGTTLYEFNDLGGESWALYTIEDNDSPLENAPIGSMSYSTLGSDFEDVSKVGFFFNYQAEEGVNFTLYMDSIEFNASVIPRKDAGR